MSNPTKKQCSNNIVQLPMGDFRPRKVLYENVKDNNQFRLYLQQNAEKLMKQNLEKVEADVKCCECEKQPAEIKAYESECQKKQNNEKKEQVEPSYLDMFKSFF